MTIELKDALVKNLEAPSKGNKITYCSTVKGFGVRVTAAGNKSFVLNYTVAGRERRYTIGQYPAWSVAAARTEAKGLRKEIDQGIDPLDERNSRREAPTMQRLWEEYETLHLPTKAVRSQADDRSMWSKYILPQLGKMTKVEDVTARDVDSLHGKIKAVTPVRANRVVEVLRKAFNLAIRWKWRSDNPCNGVAWAFEPERERFLSKAELKKLAQALDKHPDQRGCDAIRLLILTGARSGEVLKSTWDMFDLGEGIWTKPSHHTKQRRTHRVPLSGPVITLLRLMNTEATITENGQTKLRSQFLFPNSEGKPLQDIKRTWHEVRDSAKFSDVRLHDLRHTYASILASAGQSLPVIGALLGHTQTQTTMRYAHLYDGPLRLATDAVATALEYKKKRATKAAAKA